MWLLWCHGGAISLLWKSFPRFSPEPPKSAESQTLNPTTASPLQVICDQSKTPILTNRRILNVRKNNMRSFISLPIICLALTLILCQVPAADDERFGITRQVHGDSTFTFRHGLLLHEVSKLRENWVEAFYDGSKVIFIRSGYFAEGQPVTTGERFPAETPASVRQVSLPGASHPKRIYVGKEIYNRSENGFFEIMPNPEETMKESTVSGPEFSTNNLDQLRKSLLSKQQSE